ncbi:MAG: hypothetical protein JWL98_1193, partial [Xanthomonadaceae bacterium]|nr:hypothetical protein [Xanthomonadaceae bacterium]
LADHYPLISPATHDRAGLEQAVEQALALDAGQRETIGVEARAFFLDNDRAFRQRLPVAAQPER